MDWSLVQRSPTACLIVCVLTETSKGVLCSRWEPTGKRTNELREMIWCTLYFLIIAVLHTITLTLGWRMRTQNSTISTASYPQQTTLLTGDMIPSRTVLEMGRYMPVSSSSYHHHWLDSPTWVLAFLRSFCHLKYPAIASSDFMTRVFSRVGLSAPRPTSG
jgi:hypothetical protein